MFSYENAGKKIQVVAKVVMWLQTALFALIGIGVMIGKGEAVMAGSTPAPTGVAAIISGIAIIIIGAIVAWVYSLLIYGFGKIVEKSEQ